LRFRLIAVAQRTPAWAEAAMDEFHRRLGRAVPLERVAVAPEPRRAGRSVAQMLEAEARRISAQIPAGACRVVLDERGRDLTTKDFALRLQGWFASGRDTVFVIGGPDGLDEALRRSADLLLRLSSFTLPHTLARVLLLEQIYRAQSLLDNHPYHRE
jgi:23S rRNA (pseudouridine1915-N3)-methyltransferase